MIIQRTIGTALAALSSTMSHSGTCNDLHNCRSIPNIVFGCATTIFLCTWVAVHPDVPRSHTASKRVNWTEKLYTSRIMLMVVALLAPEGILTWALLQWMGSCMDLKAKLEQDPTCKWTETHAMLAKMNGLRLTSEDSMKSMKTDLASLPSYISLPSEAEIMDRSKGDTVAKGITLVQTLWFAIQAAHRASQGLDVTELELTALGHVVVNLLIYGCWWNKPLRMKFPIDVHEEESEEEDYLAKKIAPEAPLHTRVGILIGETEWGRSWTWEEWISFCVASVVGSFFGLAHCLAWNSTFPTPIEQTLWRVCAIIVTVYPCTCLIVSAVLKKPWPAFVIYAAPLTIVYCASRICLLVLAFMALRDLPHTALEIPAWTVYMPHIS